MKWIKCSERMPEIGKKVLTWNGKYFLIGERIKITSNNEETWEFGEEHYFLDPIHWMPLPDPLKDNE